MENNCLSKLNIKNAYNSLEDDIVNDFLCPCLNCAIEYKRAVGFFSSSSFALSARGIAGLVKNGGRMKLVTSPILQKKDFEVIDQFYSNDKELESILFNSIIDIDMIQDEFVKDHYRALAWMLANDKLEIRLALPEIKNGLFHLKIGIITDNEGNSVSYSGSVNESAQAWNYNVEEFKVFRSWPNELEKEFYNIDSNYFEKLWDPNKSKDLGVRTVSLPQALKEKIISEAPREFPNIEKYYQDGLKYKRIKKKKIITLFNNQLVAKEKWINNENKGIISMATGTGKTITAIACAEAVINSSKEPMLVVLTCPYSHLLDQWLNEFNKFDISFDKIIKADGSTDWRNELANLLLDMINHQKQLGLVLTTNNTFSSQDFTSIICLYANKINNLLISDEVHGLGAPEYQKGLLDCYKYRIGLSATPNRYFDEIGTEIILNYFGGIIFEFDIFNALTSINPITGSTYLTPYEYHPLFVEMDDDELEKYQKMTLKIMRNCSKMEEDRLKLLLFMRADIVKNARNKLVKLQDILLNIEDVKHTLIYCNPGQIDDVVKIINKMKIPVHRFTGKEGTTRNKKYRGLSERGFLLEEFSKGNYPVLVAMKCLDEGVDVPIAKRAILMANSGNPREHIQRIGRVLRRHPEKNRSEIYDLIVVARKEKIGDEFFTIEKRIMEKEFNRCEEIAKNASNSADALIQIYSIKNSLMR